MHVISQVKLNLHGVVGVESAQQIEEEEYEETVKVYEPAPAKVGSPASFDDLTCNVLVLRKMKPAKVALP